MLILNFTYPLRCLRVPPVEYHWSRSKCKRNQIHGYETKISCKVM